MEIVKRDTLFDVAEAFGLGRETMKRSKFADRFGSVVFCMDIPQGFCTKVLDDPLRSDGGVVAISDGYDTTLPFPWISHLYRQDRKRTPLDLTRLFQMYCATFAATEVHTPFGSIPERVFLFVDAKGFNLPRVIEKLRKYRADNPVPVFHDAWRHIDFDSLA